ncbi:MAG TPA: glycosyltransferase [Candidatus Saccharimonadales bacterium]|nr:glycosyltransferase [Candidatus Saccharimonadales bacterium]
MKLSVVIPCKNEAGTVEHLLDSILKQTRLPDEVIIVDSHSTDTTVASVNNYVDRLPVRVVAAQKQGVTHARNEGAAAAMGDVLLFIDADVRLAPNLIEKIVKYTNKGVEAGGFSQHMDAEAAHLRVGSRVMNGYVRTMSLTPWPIFFSCFFVTKRLHQELGGFDPDIWIMEDYDYAYRARQHGAKFRILPGTYFISSARRFEEGEKHSILRAVYAEAYRYTHGMKITKPLFRYSMGGHEKKTGK